MEPDYLANLLEALSHIGEAGYPVSQAHLRQVVEYNARELTRILSARDEEIRTLRADLDAARGLVEAAREYRNSDRSMPKWPQVERALHEAARATPTPTTDGEKDGCPDACRECGGPGPDPRFGICDECSPVLTFGEERPDPDEPSPTPTQGTGTKDLSLSPLCAACRHAPKTADWPGCKHAIPGGRAEHCNDFAPRDPCPDACPPERQEACAAGVTIGCVRQGRE